MELTQLELNFRDVNYWQDERWIRKKTIGKRWAREPYLKC